MGWLSSGPASLGVGMQGQVHYWSFHFPQVRAAGRKAASAALRGGHGVATLGICNACLLFCSSCYRHLCIQPLPPAALHPGWQPQGRAASSSPGAAVSFGGCTVCSPIRAGLGRGESSWICFWPCWWSKTLICSSRPWAGDEAGSTGCSSSSETAGSRTKPCWNWVWQLITSQEDVLLLSQSFLLKKPRPVCVSRPQTWWELQGFGLRASCSQLFGIWRENLMEGVGKCELALLSGLAGRGGFCLFLRTEFGPQGCSKN